MSHPAQFNEYQPLLFIASHSLFGNLALLLLGFLIVVQKGGKNHVRLGRAYLLVMIFILAPSFVISYGRAFFSPDLSLHYRISSLSFLFQNLLCSSCLWFGVRASRRRHRVSREFSLSNVLPALILFLFSIYLFVRGIESGAVILVIWSAVGLLVSIDHFMYWHLPASTVRSWRFAHADGMISASLTVITAVFVTVLPSLKVYPWSDSPLRWTLPFILGKAGFYVWWKYKGQKKGLAEDETLIKSD